MSDDLEQEGQVGGGGDAGGVVADADGEVVSSGASVAESGPLESAAPATQAEWQGVSDYARQLGVQLPADDHQALATLLSAYQRSLQPNFYEQFGRQVAPYADQVNAYIQQQRALAQQPQGRAPWQPPEWNPAWINMVERDPQTGMLFSKPGVNPNIAEKVQQYAEWRDQFLDDPAKTIQPLVEHRARELIQQEFATHRQTVEADNLVAENANWMFQADPNGVPVLHHDGSRALSPAGAVYARAVNDIWNSGVRNVRQCHLLARAQVENAVLRQQWLTNQAAAPATQAQQQQGMMPTNVGGSATRPSVSPQRGPQSMNGLGLRERLNRRLAGYSDDDAGA